MGKTFNPFQFYGLNGQDSFKPIPKPLSEEEIQSLFDSNIDMKDKFLEKVEYVGNELVFTIRTDSGTEEIKVPITDLLDKTFATDQDVADEIERATNAEQALQTAIDDEVARAEKAEGELKSAIDASVEDAEGKYQPKGDYLTEHQDISNLATKEDVTAVENKIPSLNGYATEEWVEGKNYLTEHQDISNLATKGEVTAVEDKIPSLDGYATEAWVEEKNYLTEHQSLEEYAKSSEVNTAIDGKQDKGDYVVTSAMTDAIDTAIAATEAKIFGDGDLAEAFDTIKEIGDYLKENDENVTTAINSAIATKLDKEEAAEKYQPKGNYLTEHQSLADYAKTSEVDASLEGKQNKGNYVEYSDYQGRNTIQLKNYDNISGIKTDGVGVNLAMVSKWDVADFGSTQLPINLNGSAEHPTYNDDKELAFVNEIPSIEGLLSETKAAETYQEKGDYVVATAMTDAIDTAIAASEAKIFGDGDLAEAFDTIKEIGDYLKENDENVAAAINSAITTKLDKEEAAETYQEKGDYVAYTTFEGTRKTISLGNRDTISAVTPKGGSQIAMVSDYDGLDFPVVELGGQNGALVLNTREDRVKVEVVENGKRVQHSVATLDDLNDYPKYEAYVNEAQGINKKTIVLENDDNISGKRTDGLGVNLVEISRWNVADFGSKSVHINLNGQYERPTYNDNKGIALLDDVEGLKNEMKDYVNALLKNYTLKSDEDIAKAIKAGGDVVVAKDVKATSGYTFLKESNVDLNGHSLDAVSNGNYGDNVVVGNGGNVTISNGEIKPAENASQGNQSATIMVKTAYASHLTLNNVKVTGYYPIYLNSANEGSTVMINSGEFYALNELNPAVYVGKGSTGSVIGGKVTINGGTFGQKGVTYPYLLNVEDVLRQQEGKEPRNFIEVFGGKYWNFDPSNNKAEGEGTNFVADGYKVEISQDGDDTLYTVVKE